MKKASEVINLMMESLFSDNSQREAVSLFSAWQEIAGINEGSHSKIEEIENGVVYVKVDHPGWMQKLEIKKKNILKTMQKKYPDLAIKSIRFFM